MKFKQVLTMHVIKLKENSRAVGLATGGGVTE